MAKKIATIMLIHDCNENPCHLDNENQANWIKQHLPLSKLEWNWKFFQLKIYDVQGSEEQKSVDDSLEKIMAGSQPAKQD